MRFLLLLLLMLLLLMLLLFMLLPSWGHLGPSWGRLGASWGHLGAVLWPRHLGTNLAPSWAIFLLASFLLHAFLPSYTALRLLPTVDSIPTVHSAHVQLVVLDAGHWTLEASPHRADALL